MAVFRLGCNCNDDYKSISMMNLCMCRSFVATGLAKV